MKQRPATREWGYAVVMLAGFVLTFAAFYPGLMSPDSEDQMSQAMRFAFSDWHPVMMALIWAGTNAIVRGPLGLFVLLQLMYWGGFLLICRYFANRSRACFWCALVLPFMPFLINFSGTLWKDALVFDCFLLSVGILLAYQGRRRYVPLVLAIFVFVLLVVAALARHNSVLSAIPLAALLFWPRASDGERVSAIVRRMAAASLVVVVAVLVATIALNTLLRPVKTYPSSQVLIFDLVGVSTRTGSILLPGRWTEDEGRSIKECYNPRSWDFIWLRCDFALVRLRAEDRWRRLFRPWMRAVSRHPVEYTAHRLAYVGTFFQPAHLVFNSGVTHASYDYGFTKNLLFRTIETVVVTAASAFPFSILFTKGFWFLAAPATFLLHLWMFRRDPAATYPGLLISASGALYTTPLAIVGLAHDFRYVYWGIGASCVAAVLAANVRACQSKPPTI
jgi:hypothetical protein